MALQDYRATMQGCTRCSYCKWIPFAHVKSWRFAKGCPSIDYKNFQTYSAGGRLIAALSLLDRRSSYTDKFPEIVYECLLCGNCDVTCKVCRYDMEPLETLRELRFKLVEDGQVLPQHRSIIDNLSKKDNVEHGKWAEGLKVKNLNQESAQVVFHAGCQFSFDKELRETARAALTLLINAGVDVGIMGQDELCCGGRAYDTGYRAGFTQRARSNIQAWTKAGVKKVITSCADCYHAFKRLYPAELGSNFEVLHTVEFIDQLIKEGKLQFTKAIPMAVTYHDPCHLGRQGEDYIPWKGTAKKVFGQITKHEPPKPRYNGAWGIYEAPRNILKAIPGLQLVEMERIREYAWCCGAGGGVREAYPDFSSWTARERIEEAASTGAEALVTACPWCERNFIDAAAGKGRKMKVYDIMELVQQAI
jgi:Fe-S oxidoreductase